MHNRQSKLHKEERGDNRYIFEPCHTVEGEIRMKKYVKLKVVGQGSYSKCFLVKNTESQSSYVVKIIPKYKLQRLEKEKLTYQIKIHKSLSDPTIVYLDHWFEDDNYQYIFMEYCSNGNLELKIQNQSILSEKYIRKYAYQIVRAIAYCHSMNILHRDLKLSNFYIDHNDNLKLGDFGFACQLASEYDRKRQTCGTPNYIAPQAISGFGYSFSSDVWAIGVILFRLKFGICPFEGDTVKKTLLNVKLCKYVFPKSQKISKELKELIAKIFNLNYDDRLTAEEILNHSFFHQNQKQEKEKQKRGFSLSRIFGITKQKSPKNTRKNMIERNSRNTDCQKKIEQPKRVNSCETFKQMKQIFKSKSKPTLNTTQGRQNLSTFSPYYNLTMNNFSNLNNSIDLQASKTNRYSIMQFNENPLTNKNLQKKDSSSRIGRLNQFVKTQYQNIQVKHNRKQKQKNLLQIQHQPILNIKTSKKQQKSKNITPQSQILFALLKKFNLPTKVQQQKDYLILHYSSVLKQIISNTETYIIYKQKQCIYNLQGESIKIQNLSKVIRYIIMNKIELNICSSRLKNQEQNEQYYESNIVSKMKHLAKEWVINKQGIILKYGKVDNLVIVSKMLIQQSFYISLKGKQTNFMYIFNKNQQYQIYEGVVVMRIYLGWVNKLLQK